MTVRDAAATLVVPLLLFATVYAWTLNSHRMFTWDEAEYASLARGVVRGEGFSIGGLSSALRLPMLPVAAAASIVLHGRADDAVVRRPMLLFALAALFATGWCAMAACGRITGLAAATLLGISPVFWTSTPLLMTEIPFMAFFIAAVGSCYLGLYRDPRYFYGCWAWWALAFLTRYNAVLFAPIAILFAVAAWLTGGDARRRLLNRHVVLAPLVAVALVAPWLIRQYLAFGDAFVGMRIASGQLQLFMPGVTMPWYFYLTHLPELLSPALTLLLISGIVWILWTRDRFGLHCLATAAVILLWMSAYRFKELRQVTAALPFLAVIAAAGLTKPLQRTGVAAIVRYAVVASVLLVLFLHGFRTTRPVFATRVTIGYPSFLHAMDYLRGHSAPDAVVIGANYPQIHWYADRRAEDFPDEAQLPDALMRSEWVVLTNFERSQQPYAGRLAQAPAVSTAPRDAAVLFRDAKFETALIRSTLLRVRP